jgi:hypothetical protein
MLGGITKPVLPPYLMPHRPVVAKVEPDDILPRQDGTWYLRRPPGEFAFFAITVEWCKFCKQFERSVHEAMISRPFPFLHMDGDALAAKWKMRDMGLKISYPKVFVVLRDGTLIPYERKKDADELIASLDFLDTAVSP